MRDFFSFGAAAPPDAVVAAKTLVGLSSSPLPSPSPLCLTQSLNFADPEKRCSEYAQYVEPGKQRRVSHKFCQICQHGFQVPRNRVLKLNTQSEGSQLESRSVGSGAHKEEPDNFYSLRHGDTFFVRPVNDGELFIANENLQDDGIFSLYETEDENVPFHISDNKVHLGLKRSGGYTLSGRYAKRSLEPENGPPNKHPTKKK